MGDEDALSGFRSLLRAGEPLLGEGRPRPTHWRRLERVIRAEVSQPFVDPLTLPDCIQIDRPRVPQCFVSIE